MYNHIITFIKELGFPIFVAVYLLCYLSRKINNVDKTLINLNHLLTDLKEILEKLKEKLI